MSVTDAGHTALLRSALRLANCWRVTRLDGVVLRFTSAATVIVFEQETFVPSNGFRTTARQAQAGLKDQNTELDGIIDSTLITDDDLRAGRYSGAQVDLIVVDWRFPWMGAIHEAVYYIVGVSWDGQVWGAELSSTTHRLRRTVGDVYARNCRNQLGDTLCAVNLLALTVTASVSAVTTQRLEFTSSIAGGNGDDFYNYGLLTWSSGANIGLTAEVADYTEAGGIIVFRLATEFDIAVSDQFTLHPGCDKLFGTCDVKFSNTANHGGFPTIPGTDQMLRTPGAK